MFTLDELRDLRRARALLASRSFAIKLSDLIGLPIEAGFALLPKKWSGQINRAANAAGPSKHEGAAACQAE